ncbi:MAG: ABC transporter permease [Rhodobacteraceae bacterium]|nr:ABC transporter permease [Paracoccaceae bacterium]
MSSTTTAPRARKARMSKTIIALMLREMSTTYGRSPGGFIWSVAEPVAIIALLSVAFSIAFRSPPLGQSFAVFYASGLLPFTLFLDVSQKISLALNFNKQLLSYPAVTFVDALLARFFLNVFVHVMIGIIVFSGLILFWEPRLSVDIVAMSKAYLMAAAVAMGVGTLNCYLFMVFPLWQNMWRIVTRPLFILSGIFFLYEFVPEEFQIFFWINPLVHVTAQARTAIYPVYDGTFITPEYVWSIALVTFCLGLLLLRRDYRSLLAK